MATTNFVNGETVVVADWLNDVDAHVYDQNASAHTADKIAFTPTGGSGLTETNVEDALNEVGVSVETLSTEVDTKVPLAGGTLTGHLSTIAGATGAQVPRVQDVVQKTEILGTVSQSGGIPTGAIIESGSNTNGYYIRWADGTQICTHTISLGSAAAQGSGTYASPFQTAPQSWTFPAAFVAAPVINATGWGAGASSFNRVFPVGFSAKSNTALTDIRCHKITSDATGTSATVELIAIGRWF